MHNLSHEFYYKRSVAGLLLILITSLIIAYPTTLKAIQQFPETSVITLVAVLFTGIAIYYLLLVRKALYGHHKIIIREQGLQLPGNGTSIKPLNLAYSELDHAEDLYSGIGLRRKLKIFLNTNRSILLDSNYFDTEGDYEDFLYFLNQRVKVKTRDKLRPPPVVVLANILLQNHSAQKGSVQDTKQLILNSAISKKEQRALLKNISGIHKAYTLAKNESELVDQLENILKPKQRWLKILVVVIEVIILVILAGILFAIINTGF